MALPVSLHFFKQSTSLTLLARSEDLPEEGSDCLLSCSYSASAYLSDHWTTSCDFSFLTGKTVTAPILGIGGGINRQVVPEGMTPSLSISCYSSFVEIDSGGGLLSFLPSFSVGATGRKTMDPIAIECSLGGQFFLPQNVQDRTLQRGILLFFEPTCFFWATPDLASFVSTKWKIKCSDSLGNKRVAPSRLQTELAVGVRYTGLEDQVFGFETGFTTLDPKQAFMTLQVAWKTNF
ncbi:hypothetical protein [Candidatus Similichlamydia laticola]|nr:hypothetical protein [Candidatus Similichlamydia laticola]